MRQVVTIHSNHVLERSEEKIARVRIASFRLTSFQTDGEVPGVGDVVYKSDDVARVTSVNSIALARVNL